MNFLFICFILSSLINFCVSLSPNFKLKKAYWAYSISFGILLAALNLLRIQGEVWAYAFALVLIQCVCLVVSVKINLRHEELEKQKEIYLNELKESNSVLAEEKLVNEILIRTITHDLSGPLTNISNYCDLFDSGKIEDKERKLVLERVSFNAQSAITKITNTKTALKTRSMAADILLEEVCIKESINNLLKVHDRALKNKELTCEVLYPEDSKVLASESALVEHVLSHVLTNAIKYSHRGQKIKISAESKSERTLVVEIRDYGIGLPNSAYEKRILSSLKGTEGETGNGFGMMIMGYFMRRFGGSYTLETPSEGPGTRVLLKFRKNLPC
jgi:K+-sensing histidine kinase KdpD